MSIPYGLHDCLRWTYSNEQMVGGNGIGQHTELAGWQVLYKRKTSPHAFVYKKFNTKTLCMKKGLLGEVYRMTDERLKCPFRLKSQDRCLVAATGRRSFCWL